VSQKPEFALDQHIIIIGWNAFSRLITRELLAADKHVVVVTNEAEEREKISREFAPEQVFVYLDPLTTFEKLDAIGIEDARQIFVNLQNDEDELVAILHMKNAYEGLNFVVVLSNAELKGTFYAAGVTYVVSEAEIASNLVATHAFEPAVGKVMTDLLSVDPQAEKDYDIRQYRIQADNALAGSLYDDLFWQLKHTYENCLLIGLSKPDGTRKAGLAASRKLYKLPDGDLQVDAGDDIIVVVERAAAERLQRDLGVTGDLGLVLNQ
jgi:voltage-gated potassium channel